MGRCLVLGGGGVAGIAWQVGVVHGLAAAGVTLQQADLFIGTSAGSVVGAQLAARAEIEHLYRQQVDPPADSAERFRSYSQGAADKQNRVLLVKVGGDLDAARCRIGAFALRSSTVSPAERRAIIAARLKSADWPTAPLKVVAVDVRSAKARVFDAASGVDFIDAVAASCAVPGAWPVVEIDGEGYMDGGIRSITNADFASGFERVVVLAPFGYSDGNPISGHLRREVNTLRSEDSKVCVIEPDSASLLALGENVLDPSRRTASALAGHVQGLAFASTVAAVWEQRSAPDSRNLQVGVR